MVLAQGSVLWQQQHHGMYHKAQCQRIPYPQPTSRISSTNLQSCGAIRKSLSTAKHRTHLVLKLFVPHHHVPPAHQ